MITNIFRILFTRSFEPLILTNKIDYSLNIDSDEIGLYVHIPFCSTLCSFCPYNKILYDEYVAKEYKEAII